MQTMRGYNIGIGLYGDQCDLEILDDILEQSVPQHALVDGESWKRIEDVHSRYYCEICDEIWQDLCDRHDNASEGCESETFSDYIAEFASVMVSA